MNTQSFRDLAEKEGYTVRDTISGEANNENTVHAYDFDAKMLVLSGDITYSFDGSKRAYREGETIEVIAGILHFEKIGESGVSLLAASRQPLGLNQTQTMRTEQ